MKLDYAIYLFSGEKILVTEDQRDSIKKALSAGGQWISCGDEFINAKNIASLGTHTSTADMRKIKESTAETQLAEENPKMHKKLLAMKKGKSIKATMGDNMDDYEKLVGSKIRDIKELPQSDQQEIDGEPAYYVDENGEKMYS